MLSLEERKAIGSSWRKASEQGNLFAALLYQNLFIMNPDTASLFHVSIAEQGQKLMHMLHAVVFVVERTGELPGDMVALLERHRGYGVKPHHFEAYRVAFHEAMSLCCSFEYETGSREAWDALFDSIQHMVYDVMPV
jgi:nitric oxide dioxygenase